MYQFIGLIFGAFAGSFLFTRLTNIALIKLNVSRRLTPFISSLLVLILYLIVSSKSFGLITSLLLYGPFVLTWLTFDLARAEGSRKPLGRGRVLEDN